MPPVVDMSWAQKEYLDKAPIWCSVDLRDGNQSLIIPMSLEEKLEFFQFLVKIGFKEIEVGFPAASETEYEFLRRLIEDDLIPDDVTVQVLTQCREHIIRKTFDACKGAPNAIIHFYNSTSVAQREQVFRKSKEEIKQIAIDGAKLVKKLAAEYEGKAVVCKCNVDECDDVPMDYGIRSIPTLLFFKGGEVVDRHVGAATKDVLAAKISALL